MKSKHQMSEIEQNAFEEHCRASETIIKVEVPLWEYDVLNARDTDKPGKLLTRIFKVKGYDNGKSSSKYFWEDWPKHLQESFNEVDDKHHNGYFQQRYEMEDCYPCATQRHSCEHDGRDDSEDLPEWWNEV
jgi:hypothetical protein